jgi:hypothetical protein
MRRVHDSQRPHETKPSAINPRIQLVIDDLPPTSNALAQFQVTIRWTQGDKAVQYPEHIAWIAGKETEATPSAEAKIIYRNAHGWFRVPYRQAGHLLDLMACATGIGGIVAASTVILRFSAASPLTRGVLCGLCVAIIAGLAAATILRNRN